MKNEITLATRRLRFYGGKYTIQIPAEYVRDEKLPEKTHFRIIRIVGTPDLLLQPVLTDSERGNTSSQGGS